MDMNRFEEIKEKISAANTQRTRAEGVIETIKEKWAEQGIDSIEAARARISECTNNIADYDKKIDTLMKELESITDWDAV